MKHLACGRSELAHASIYRAMNVLGARARGVLRERSRGYLRGDLLERFGKRLRVLRAR